MAHLQPRPSSPSRSRSRLRPTVSRRGTSRSSIPYLPGGPIDLINPEGPVSEETNELLQEFVHPHHHVEDATLVEEEDENDGSDEDIQLANQAKVERRALPWWKRPSPYWFLCLMPLSSIAMSTTIAPRIEIYTMLACDAVRPELTAGRGMDGLGIRLPWGDSPNDITFGAGSAPIFHTDGAPSHIALDTDNSTLPNPKLCLSDPVVQAAVARLTATLTTGQGILAILTTAWWLSLSDRRGRVRVIGATIFGVLLMDFNFILVALFSKRLPGGYWLLLIGPLVEGLLGGLSTAGATVHAYVTDCVEPAERSRVFSLNMGLLFIGMALGPTLGGQLIHYTGNTLSVFYLATCVHMLYAIINWFILPESLSEDQRAASQKKHDAILAARREATVGLRPVVAVVYKIKSVLSIFAPLEIFLPIHEEGANPLKAKKRDWNLTFVITAHAFTVLILGSYSYKFQYAQAKFNWNSENLSYLISAVGATRAIHLVVVLPLIIKVFKPKARPIQLPIAPSEPLNHHEDGQPSSSTLPDTEATPLGAKGGARHHHLGAGAHDHSLRFDLLIARASLLLEILAYTAMALAPTGRAFLLASVSASLAGGFGPALSSVAVELFGARGGTENGRLFGGMALVQALCSHVIGPATFGILYLKTVKTNPGAIFWISVIAVSLSLVCMCLVRLPKRNSDLEEPVHAPLHTQREDTLVDVSVESNGK